MKKNDLFENIQIITLNLPPCHKQDNERYVRRKSYNDLFVIYNKERYFADDSNSTRQETSEIASYL